MTDAELKALQDKMAKLEEANKKLAEEKERALTSEAEAIRALEIKTDSKIVTPKKIMSSVEDPATGIVTDTYSRAIKDYSKNSVNLIITTKKLSNESKGGK